LRVAGILITQHQAEAEHNRGMMEALREAFGGTVFESMIPYSASAKDSVASAQSVLAFDPDSPVAAAYRGLANELTLPHA
jgi:chromosome partitioning protein